MARTAPDAPVKVPTALDPQPPPTNSKTSELGHAFGAGPLATFYQSLSDLGAGTRGSHVRVLWLGDSHTNADFLSGSVRQVLSNAFGDGGPGMLRLGTKPYRHDGVKVTREGSWNVDPDPPARRAPQDDGVFGLVGTRAVPADGASFSLRIDARGKALDADARFELTYSLPPGASFELRLGPIKRVIDGNTSASRTPFGLAHLTLTAPLGSLLQLGRSRGAPRLLAVNIERADRVGVVVDTSGIDGARLQTPLAWSRAAFSDEIARRAPELVVLAYGTNEAFDALGVDKYSAQLTELVERVRAGAPRISCLVLGPPDAAMGEGSVPRVAQITAVLQAAAAPLGCSFVSLQQLMGGEGSFARGLRAPERLAQPDGLHLTPEGYRQLGSALGNLLLSAHSAGRTDLP